MITLPQLLLGGIISSSKFKYGYFYEYFSTLQVE